MTNPDNKNEIPPVDTVSKAFAAVLVIEETKFFQSVFMAMAAVGTIFLFLTILGSQIIGIFEILVILTSAILYFRIKKKHEYLKGKYKI